MIGLQEDFSHALEATHEINPLVPQTLAQPDTPVDRREVMDDKTFFKSGICRRCFSRYDINHILSTSHVDHSSGLYSLLTLYRRDRKHGFIDSDRTQQARQARLTRLTFHLLNSASHAFFLHLNRTHAGRAAESAAAVVDCKGLFHEVQPRFIQLLDQHFPQRDPTGGLPFVPPTETNADLREFVRQDRSA